MFGYSCWVTGTLYCITGNPVYLRPCPKWNTALTAPSAHLHWSPLIRYSLQLWTVSSMHWSGTLQPSVARLPFHFKCSAEAQRLFAVRLMTKWFGDLILYIIQKLFTVKDSYMDANGRSMTDTKASQLQSISERLQKIMHCLNSKLMKLQPNYLRVLWDGAKGEAALLKFQTSAFLSQGPWASFRSWKELKKHSFPRNFLHEISATSDSPFLASCYSSHNINIPTVYKNNRPQVNWLLVP